jgi:hypothetical protein
MIFDSLQVFARLLIQSRLNRINQQANNNDFNFRHHFLRSGVLLAYKAGSSFLCVYQFRYFHQSGKRDSNPQ